MTTALVIGGTGFVGLNIVDALLAEGQTVKVSRRRNSITAYVRRRHVELVHASLDDELGLRDAMDGIDVVYLAGAYYPRYSTDRASAIARGVEQLRAACSAARMAGVRLVYTSSTGALEAPRDGRPADERDIPAAMPSDSVYRATKWAMERELESHLARGLDAVTLIPGACIGPLDVRVGTGGILLGAVHGTLPWWVDGIVNAVDVGDVATAHLAAARLGKAGDRFCVAGHDMRLGELLRRIVARYGGRIPPRPISLDEGRVRADTAEREAEPQKARVPFPRELVDLLAAGHPVSSRRAESELGTTFRPLTETLDRAWAWFVRHHYLPARRAMEEPA